MKVWIVGGTSGIGEAVAKNLTSRHEVYPTGAAVDVRSEPKIVKFVADCGPFDAIVYSAGVNTLDWLQDILAADMLYMYHVNVVGLVQVLQACPEARRVVAIGSDAAWRPMRTSIMYNASKAALHEAVRCIARERASEDFAINAVAAGLTDTPMTEYILDRTKETRPDLDVNDYMVSQIPMARAAQPWEIAEVVVKVLEMDTNYLNGAIIPVNGAR